MVAVGANETVVPASELQEAMRRIKQLEGALGRKTLENEILKEAVRKLPQIENNMKIEASISLRRRDEEVKIYREPDCCNLG